MSTAHLEDTPVLSLNYFRSKLKELHPDIDDLIYDDDDGTGVMIVTDGSEYTKQEFIENSTTWILFQSFECWAEATLSLDRIPGKSRADSLA